MSEEGETEGVLENAALSPDEEQNNASSSKKRKKKQKKVHTFLCI